MVKDFQFSRLSCFGCTFRDGSAMATVLIDYRRGERYFASTLIDWDLSNNTQGWEPSYTVFNPVSQAEKNDPDGDYIRKCKSSYPF